MMRSIYAILFMFTLNACSTNAPIKPLRPEEIIEKSIAFHDPKNEWKNLNARFKFESSFSFNDSVPEELVVDIDVIGNGFIYHNKDRKVKIAYPKDSCHVLSSKGSCDGYSWTKNFYTYVWGLPMKLMDPGIKPQKEVSRALIKNDSCHVVRVHYPAENFKFYIDMKDYQLRAFEFIKNDESGKAELVYLKGIYKYKHMRFPKHKTWMQTKDKSLIGTNEVVRISPI